MRTFSIIPAGFSRASARESGHVRGLRGVRNPKPEGRKKSETRNPKSESRLQNARSPIWKACSPSPQPSPSWSPHGEGEPFGARAKVEATRVLELSPIRPLPKGPKGEGWGEGEVPLRKSCVV